MIPSARNIPPHIVFALFQVFEMLKDFEVLVVERRDNEEYYHFVRSHNVLRI